MKIKKILYSVSGDMEFSPLESALGDYGYAKFLYDRWRADSEVFNVIMYRHEDGVKTIKM